jgi:hypothetical protein
MFGGGPRAWMFRRVHNYDLKKDNYDLKKKGQSSGGFIITSGKIRLSHLAISGNVWGGSMSLDVLAGS